MATELQIKHFKQRLEKILRNYKCEDGTPRFGEEQISEILDDFSFGQLIDHGSSPEYIADINAQFN